MGATGAFSTVLNDLTNLPQAVTDAQEARDAALAAKTAAEDAATAAAASNPGAPNGTAQLDGDSKLKEEQVPDRLSESGLLASYGFALNVRAFGAVGDGVADDTTAIQAALDALGEFGSLFIPEGTYKITATLLYPSRCRVYGPGLINQTTLGLPALASRNWVSALNEAPTGFAKLDVKVKTVAGNAAAHGVILRDFFSEVSAVCEGTGGDAVHVTHLNDVGATTGVGGSLVENRFPVIDARDHGGYALFAGPSGNNKLTDGYIGHIYARGNGGPGHVFIGSSAGWQVGKIHAYGTCTGSSVTYDGAYHTDGGDLYIETGYGGSAVAFPSLQRAASLGRVTVMLPNRDNAVAVAVSKSAFSPGDGLSIGALTLVQDFNRPTFAVSSTDPAVPIDIASLVKNGTYKSRITTATGAGAVGIKARSNIAESSSGTALVGGRGLALTSRAAWNGAGPFALDLNVLDAPPFGSIVGTLYIHGPQFNNGGQLTRYQGQFSISAKDTADPVALYLNQVVAPAGFTVAPTISRPAANTLRVSFTPDTGNVFGGVVSVIYAVV